MAISPSAPSSEAPATSARPLFGWQRALALLIALRVGLGMIGMISVHLQPVTFITGNYSNLLIHGGEPWSQLISIWQRWDAFFYEQIALHGYRPWDGTAAFYPLYPLLSRAASIVLAGHIVIAELAVSSAAFGVAMWLLYRLALLDVPPTAALLTVLLVTFFPTGFFLLAPYTESLFLLLTVAAFWFARIDRPWLAGLAAFGAGLTRLQGAILVLPLAFITFRRAEGRGRRPGLDLLAAVLPSLGLILFTAYLHAVVGVHTSSLGVQSMWGYRIVPPWQALGASAHYILHPTDPTQPPIEILNLVCLLGASVLGLLALWRLPLSYALYVWPSLLLLYTREMGYTPLMSVSRFTVVLFPCFIVLAALLARRPTLALSWLAVGILLQATLFEAWVHFVFVA